MKRAQSIGRPQPRALLSGARSKHFSGSCSRLAAALLLGACILPAHADGDDADWQQLFRFTTFRSVAPGDVLIRQGEPER